jgi:hypothetical protein
MDEYLTEMHRIAKERFERDRSKCYQRHIRELWSETEPREQLTSLAGAVVERITREEAESIILKYEWLQTTGRGVQAFYGLRLNGELLGANCLGQVGGDISNICGRANARKAACLMRGAMQHWAHPHAASYFTSRTCRQAHKDFGWSIFFAYSDTADASEIGTIYSACNWYFIGEDLGKTQGSFHIDFISPDGTKRLTSHMMNHDTSRKFLRGLGWSEDKGPVRFYLKRLGWTPKIVHGKKKWVWFEGTRAERAYLKSVCRYGFLPHPKRQSASEVTAAAFAPVMSFDDASVTLAMPSSRPQELGTLLAGRSGAHHQGTPPTSGYHHSHGGVQPSRQT